MLVEIVRNKLRLVKAWIDIHEEELMADWTLAVNGGALICVIFGLQI